MRTKRIKAANVRIGDVLYAYGTVTGILHLDRNTLDIYVETYDRVVRDFDDLVEIVTSSTNPAVVLP